MSVTHEKEDVEGDELHPNETIEEGAQGREGEPEEMREVSAPPVPHFALEGGSAKTSPNTSTIQSVVSTLH